MRSPVLDRLLQDTEKRRKNQEGLELFKEFTAKSEILKSRSQSNDRKGTRSTQEFLKDQEELELKRQDRLTNV